MTVNKVEETGTAFSEGIRVGDQIVSINGKDVIDLKSFCHELNGTKGLLRIQIQKSVFPKKKDTDIANLIFGSNNMKNNGVKQNNSLEIKELSVKIPRNNFSFPLLPSTASSSSYSSGLEILKHMDVLKSSVKRKKTKERPMFLQNYPKYNLNSVSTVSAHSNYTSSETEETIDSNTFSGNDSGVENNQSGDEETINGLNSDTCSIEKSPLSLNENVNENSFLKKQNNMTGNQPLHLPSINPIAYNNERSNDISKEILPVFDLDKSIIEQNSSECRHRHSSPNTTNVSLNELCSDFLKEFDNMVNIPPPPPIPSKSPIPGIRHWNIPTEPSVSNIGKAEGIVEIPEKQSVSNLRTQITNKLLMKTPTGAVVQEPVKVQTKSLLNEQFKSNLDDYSDNHLSNKEGIRSRSLTPMSFYHNGPLAKNSSTSRVSINNVGISDDSDGVSTLRRMRSELTTPSFQRATLCNSTYELNDDSNDKSELTNGDSNLKIFTPYQSNSIKDPSLSNLSDIKPDSSVKPEHNEAHIKSTCASPYENNYLTSYQNNSSTVYPVTLSMSSSTPAVNNISGQNVNTTFCPESDLNKLHNQSHSPLSNEQEKTSNNEENKSFFGFPKSTINLSSISPSSFFSNFFTTAKTTPDDEVNTNNATIKKSQDLMTNSYDSPRLSQLIDQTNQLFDKSLNVSYTNNLPQHNHSTTFNASRSASAVPFATLSPNSNLDKDSCAESMSSSQQYSSLQVNGESRDGSSSWYKNMYKKLHKIDGDDTSVLKYHYTRDSSPALNNSRAVTPALSKSFADYSLPDEGQGAFQRSKSVTRFQSPYSTNPESNFSNTPLQWNDQKQYLSQSRVSLAPGHPSDPNEALELLQNSNQILSRGINDLKKNQFNEIIQKTKGEKLSEELSTQQSRRHGYIPSSTPSLQNNFDRFDGLIKNFDNTPMSRQSPFPEYKTAIALFKFNGKNVRELSLNKGDVVKVHREIDGNWIEGERNGKFGMFPACYVQLNEGSKIDSEQKIIAFYQFFGRNKNELSLKAGEVIKKTRDIDSNWIEGVNQHGEIGIFPSNYVKPYHDSEQKSGMSSMPSYSMTSVNATNSVCGPPSESTYGGFERSGSVAPERPKTPKFMANLTSQPQPQFAQMSQNGSGEPSRVISPLQPKRQPNRLPEIQQWQQRHHSEGLSGPANLVPRNSEIYRAINIYKPQQEGELELQHGDIIFVVEKLTDGFVIGLLLRTNQFGVVPGSLIIRH